MKQQQMMMALVPLLKYYDCDGICLADADGDGM